MTPLAAQIFRHGDETNRKMLSMGQFFEVSKIVDMAEEMGLADVAEGGSNYSEMAQLPSPVTIMEFARHTGRMMLAVEQHGDDIRYAAFVRNEDEVVPRLRFISGFRLGTEDNLEFWWAVWEGEPGYKDEGSRYLGEAPDGGIQERACHSFNLHLEKLLLIINQPGLVQRVLRPTDKRVTRLLKNMPGSPKIDGWHECSIRPGHHGEAVGGDGAPRALHYVRKYFKPTLGRWVDGYWRGDAALGTIFKWYSVPGSRAEAMLHGETA